jgi:hypothetical protein
VQNYLAVSLQNIRGKIRAVISGKCHPAAQQRVAYLLLAFGPVNTINLTVAIAIAVMRIHFTGGDYWDVIGPGPGHYPADTAQNSPVIPYANAAAEYEEVPLGVDVHQYVPPTSFKQLPNHRPSLLLIANISSSNGCAPLVTEFNVLIEHVTYQL